MENNEEYSDDNDNKSSNKDPIIGKTFFSKYKAVKKLGEGSFGKVYKAEYNGENYALKMEFKSKEQVEKNEKVAGKKHSFTISKIKFTIEEKNEEKNEVKNEENIQNQMQEEPKQDI